MVSIYKRDHGWLIHWLRRKMGGSDSAADLAQDTFVRLMSKPAVLQSLHEPRAYLATVAHGLLVDHWRRLSLERAWMEALASLPEDQAGSPEDRLVALQALQEIDRLLDQLAPKAREVFVLSQVDGLTYREISERMQLAERSVRRYMAVSYTHLTLPTILLV